MVSNNLAPFHLSKAQIKKIAQGGCINGLPAHAGSGQDYEMMLPLDGEGEQKKYISLHRHHHKNGHMKRMAVDGGKIISVHGKGFLDSLLKGIKKIAPIVGGVADFADKIGIPGASTVSKIANGANTIAGHLGGEGVRNMRVGRGIDGGQVSGDGFLSGLLGNFGLGVGDGVGDGVHRKARGKGVNGEGFLSDLASSFGLGVGEGVGEGVHKKRRGRKPNASSLAGGEVNGEGFLSDLASSFGLGVGEGVHKKRRGRKPNAVKGKGFLGGLLSSFGLGVHSHPGVGNVSNVVGTNYL